MRPPAFLDYVNDNPVEEKRYLTLKKDLKSLRDLVLNICLPDCGASYGLSMRALTEVSGSTVIGFEPDEKRVRRGAHILRESEIIGTPRLLAGACLPAATATQSLAAHFPS